MGGLCTVPATPATRLGRLGARTLLAEGLSSRTVPAAPATRLGCLAARTLLAMRDAIPASKSPRTLLRPPATTTPASRLGRLDARSLVAVSAAVPAGWLSPVLLAANPCCRNMRRSENEREDVLANLNGYRWAQSMAGGVGRTRRSRGGMGVSDEGSRVGVVVGGRATEITSSETPSDHTTLTKRERRKQTTKPQPHPTSPLGSGGGLEAILIK